jgi:hypothetical protein
VSSSRSLQHASLLLALLTATCQSQQSTPAPAPWQDSQSGTEQKKPKKVWTNEDLSGVQASVSVVGDPKVKPNHPVKKTANLQSVASLRKQLQKLEKEQADIEQQITDLKNFRSGEPSASSGFRLDKRYQREPLDVQIKALEKKLKDVQAQTDALLDQARKNGVEPGQLR